MTALLVSLPWAVLSGGLLYALIRQADRSAIERGDLYQRIQAPDIAVAQHVMATESEPAGLGYVPIDDDDALIADFQEQLHGS